MRFTIQQLEEMKTHELAELLSNFVLLLRRLPNVPFSQLDQISAEEPGPSPEANGHDKSGPSLVDCAHERVNDVRRVPWWTESK